MASSPPPAKRTLPSSSAPSPSSKRQRTSPTPPSPSQPKKPIDARARTRRLFGALLGGAARPNAPSTPDKPDILATRQRIEARARQRSDAAVPPAPGHVLSRLSDAERARRQRAVERRDRRRVEEAVRDREGTLETSAEPRVLWRPWKLTGDQEERVRERKGEVQREIEGLRERWKGEDERREKEGVGKGERERRREQRLGTEDGGDGGDGRTGEKGRPRSMSYDEGGENGGDAEDNVVY